MDGRELEVRLRCVQSILHYDSLSVIFISDRATSKCARGGLSPSALFARRLMHHFSAQALLLENSATRGTDVSPGHSAPLPLAGTTLNNIWSWTTDPDHLTEELEDSLKDLEEGLDILMILERAYECTMKAHVTTEPMQASSTQPLTEAGVSALSISGEDDQPIGIEHGARSPPPDTLAPSTPKSVPLLTGSSTALVAVLQHSTCGTHGTQPPPPRMLLSASTSPQSYDAVLKIAHLGDCMGMLVRDEKIAWRSVEMWCAFNTPVQLGPRSSTRPSDAQIVELPVQADDILILASDGLSDNLWDSEVLDEVVRLKRSFSRNGEIGVSGLLGRRTLAGMLSEALCSRARRVSERKGNTLTDDDGELEEEVPFARRAREQGKTFKGGKIDGKRLL